MDKIFGAITKMTLLLRIIIVTILFSIIISTIVIVVRTLESVPVYEAKVQPVYNATIYIDRGNTVDIENIENIEIAEYTEEHKPILPHLPKGFEYRQFDHDKLKSWLKNRNSMFSQDNYFYIITDTAESFGINPILLFSILGQEQNFVPVDDEYANEMINNPFNVFRSWRDYNTNLQDATEIACRTVITICKSLPEGTNPFRWLNSRDGTGGYAEDPLWCEGVEFFFNKLSEVVDK